MTQTDETTGQTVIAVPAAGSADPRSPFCRELRSKRFYSLETLPTAEQDYLDLSGHCWCRKTMLAVGPDGKLARPENCKPGRACYLSLFQESAAAE